MIVKKFHTKTAMTIVTYIVWCRCYQDYYFLLNVIRFFMITMPSYAAIVVGNLQCRYLKYVNIYRF